MLERPDGAGVAGAVPSESDRDEAVALLRAQCADGRLTLDEFADRVVAVLQAPTKDDVARQLADLPAPAGDTSSDDTSSGDSSSTTWVVGIMWGSARRGRWRPGKQVKALAFWGGCVMDLRGAELTEPVLHISAVAIMGGIDIVVPDGVRVEVNGLPIMGGIERKIKDVPTVPGTPLIKVRAFAFWGGVTVRSRPSRTNEEQGRRIEDRGGAHQRVPPADRSLERVAAEVQRERPDLSADAMPDGTVTILFSDIENFTVLTERLGDLRAQEVVRSHNEIVRAQVAACGGHEVKSQGDSFMVSFAGARRGLRCAIGIQRAFEEWTEKHPDTPLRVRIGLHTGEAIREEHDLFGRSVIMAARIAAQAEGGVILVSSLLKELAEASGEFSFGPPRSATLKGLSGEHLLYPVAWEPDEPSVAGTA